MQSQINKCKLLSNLLSKAFHQPKNQIGHDQTSTFQETQQQHLIHKDQHDANIRVYGWEHFFDHNSEKYFKSAPRRGIEPRSPAWQAGILTTILTRTGNKFEDVLLHTIRMKTSIKFSFCCPVHSSWYALEFIVSWRPKIERSLKYICCTYFDSM